MMRSLYSGVTGLRNHQTKMDVIGNNISNVNTVGFKASRVIFQDIYARRCAWAAATYTPRVQTRSRSALACSLQRSMSWIPRRTHNIPRVA